MKKAFKLNNLDCAHCAMKIEDAVKKIPGVEEATVNFMTTKMTIQAERDAMPEIVEKATKIVTQLEPDVEVVKA